MAVVRGSRRRLRMENSTRLVLSGMPRQIRKAPGMPMAYTCSRRPPVAYDAQSLQQVPVHARGLQELHLAKRRTGRLSRKEFATQRAGVRHWYGCTAAAMRLKERARYCRVCVTTRAKA